MKSFHLSVPARINILGNPSDANEGDFATITAAVDLRAHAFIEPCEAIEFVMLEPQGENFKHLATDRFETGTYPMPLSGPSALMQGAYNRLAAYSSELRKHLESGAGFRVTAWSHVPRQSGLGGSSLFVMLTLAALRKFFELDAYRHNDYVIAELTQRAEAHELGITCGYADRYVPIFGGLAYLDYREKLYQDGIDAEPYATYERLDAYVSELPIVAIMTGIQHDSGDVHGRMRPVYIEEHEEYLRNPRETPTMVRIMRGVYETAWRGKIALLKQDLPAFGKLMNRNHHLVDEMMQYCGFEDGAGWANNLLINTALENGALGAKLTGAGGGGSVYALVPPGGEQHLVDTWSQVARQHGLDKSQIYIPRVTTRGLTLEEAPQPQYAGHRISRG